MITEESDGMSIDTVEKAIKEIKKGKMVIVVDDEDRENEGDFIMVAEKVTPEDINFMTKFGRGLICMPCISSRLNELKIPDMVNENTSKHGTAFTVSVGAKHKISTGISAFDRAQTILTIVDPKTKPEDISRPGHIFPLRARDGGVLKRAGHTEATVDLARLAGFFQAGVLCEIMNDNGTMARLPQLEKISKKFNMPIVTVLSIIEYRRKREKLIKRMSETTLPTEFGEYDIIAYQSVLDKKVHIVLKKGKVRGVQNVLVRVHSQCITGDVFRSLRCDCGQQLSKALKMIQKEGRGILLYMQQEGRGIGLINKLRAYKLQDEGLDTVEANRALGFSPDLRDYGIGAQILVDLGLSTIRLMTNNPKKVVGLEGYGLKIIERIPIIVDVHKENIKYLQTKRDKLSHLIDDI